MVKCPNSQTRTHLAASPPTPAVRRAPLDHRKGVSRPARDLRHYQAREDSEMRVVLVLVFKGKARGGGGVSRRGHGGKGVVCLQPAVAVGKLLQQQAGGAPAAAY